MIGKILFFAGGMSFILFYIYAIHLIEKISKYAKSIDSTLQDILSEMPKQKTQISWGPH